MPLSNRDSKTEFCHRCLRACSMVSVFRPLVCHRQSSNMPMLGCSPAVAAACAAELQPARHSAQLCQQQHLPKWTWQVSKPRHRRLNQWSCSRRRYSQMEVPQWNRIRHGSILAVACSPVHICSIIKRQGSPVQHAESLALPESTSCARRPNHGYIDTHFGQTTTFP